MEEPKIKVMITGLVISVEFQKCKLYAERLVRTLPNKFEKPDIRPLLDVSWQQSLTKIQRKIGGRVWKLKKNCAVFVNGQFLGDDDDFFHYTMNIVRLRIGGDFHEMGVRHLSGMYNESIKDGNKFAYCCIKIDGKTIGTMMFLLYSELVPLTTAMFLKRCASKRHGWSNTKIHRIVKGSWLQAGGLNLQAKRMPCENYIIPHNRRGILSMCHGGKHSRNNVQFIISLDSTPWMDYKYVAFGRVIQGEDVLSQIEEVPTRYESPKVEITIVSCHEFVYTLQPDPKDIEAMKEYQETADPITCIPEDIECAHDVESNLSLTNYQKGDYSLDTDLKSNMDLMRLPSFLLRLYMDYTGTSFAGVDVNDEGEHDDLSTPSEPIPIVETMQYKASLQLRKSRHEKQEAEVDQVEVLQKVTQFEDKETRRKRSLRPTSSDQLYMDDLNTLYV